MNAHSTDLPVTYRKASDVFSRDELSALTARSDLRGLWAIVSSWAIVAGALTLLAWWPNALTLALALCLIAGRQLAFGILQHEGCHGTLFETRWMNNVLTDWLCARPVWQHLAKYRAHHLRHHLKAGTDQDPDISLHAGYPITRGSMARKLLRDLSGITGLKLLLGLTLMDVGLFRWTVANHLERLPQKGRRFWEYPLTFLRNAWGMLLTNAVLFCILAATGHPWLYGVWVLAYLTPFPLFVRIRSIAEHGVRTRVPDAWENTRTTRAGWLMRATLAPVNVNYHTEHHVMASVPYHRLPEMHRILRERGAVPEPPSYFEVLALASSLPRGARAHRNPMVGSDESGAASAPTDAGSPSA
ncbi:MAG TPA: fatty acid desaturase family protein [Labilithrix sp.]|nr:fatty acid desaturase family protein [Labilithrix sp.]